MIYRRFQAHWASVAHITRLRPFEFLELIGD